MNYEKMKCLRDAHWVFSAQIQNSSPYRRVCCLHTHTHKRGNPSFAHSIETRINNVVPWNPKKKADLLNSYLKYGCYMSILQSENIRKWQWLRCFALFKKSRPVLIQIPLHLIIQSWPLLVIQNYRIWCKFLPS